MNFSHSIPTYKQKEIIIDLLPDIEQRLYRIIVSNGFDPENFDLNWVPNEDDPTSLNPDGLVFELIRYKYILGLLGNLG